MNLLFNQKCVYLSRVRHVVVVVVNDGSLLLIKLDATLAAQLPQRVTCVTGGEH